MKFHKLQLLLILMYLSPNIIYPLAAHLAYVIPTSEIIPFYLNISYLISTVLLLIVAVLTTLPLFIAMEKIKKNPDEKKLITIQKRVKRVPLLLTLIVPVIFMIVSQLAVFGHDYGSLVNRMFFMLLAYAIGMLICLPFSIFIIDKFEAYASFIPFNEKFLTMPYVKRSGLINVLSTTAMIIYFVLAMRGFIVHKNEVGEGIDPTDILVRLNPVIFSCLISGLFTNMLISRNAGKRLARINKTLSVISKRDLSMELVSSTSRDDLGNIINTENVLISNLRETLSEIKKSANDTMVIKDSLMKLVESTKSNTEAIIDRSNKVDTQVEFMDQSVGESFEMISGLNDQIGQLNQNITNQASMVEESTAAITQMIASIDSIAAIARKKVTVSETLITTANEGNEKLKDTIGKINEISTSISDIKEITTLIMGIAARTNLLAMNAAIEAAHAGEAGRGFSVVADEIRKLAETATGSSKRINENIGSIIESINASTVSGGVTSQVFDVINNEINEVVHSFKEIDTGVSELKVGGDQIMQAISGLQSLSMDVKDRSREMLKKTKEVSQNISGLGIISKETSKASGNIKEKSRDITESTEMLASDANQLNKKGNKLIETVETFKL